MVAVAWLCKQQILATEFAREDPLGPTGQGATEAPLSLLT